MRNPLSPWVVGVIATLALHSPVAMAAGIQVTEAWSRATVGTGAGVIYLTIENTGAQAERVVSASTPIAKRASLHETVRKDGTMQMRPAKNLEIAPGSQLVFAPGGLHVMLMGLESPIAEGSRFVLTLRFEHAGAVDVEVIAGGMGALGPPNVPKVDAE